MHQQYGRARHALLMGLCTHGAQLMKALPTLSFLGAPKARGSAELRHHGIDAMAILEGSRLSGFPRQFARSRSGIDYFIRLSRGGRRWSGSSCTSTLALQHGLSPKTTNSWLCELEHQPPGRSASR